VSAVTGLAQRQMTESEWYPALRMYLVEIHMLPWHRREPLPLITIGDPDRSDHDAGHVNETED
jgi:hypothetical protein